VDAGDGADDGEAEPGPAGTAGSLGAESLERLEEAVHFAGGISVPVLLTDTVASPSVSVVEISTRPPSRLCRMALSTRFATRLSARLGSPVAGAA